jgi:hypothetical protein
LNFPSKESVTILVLHVLHSCFRSSTVLISAHALD